MGLGACAARHGFGAVTYDGAEATVYQLIAVDLLLAVGGVDVCLLL